MSQLILSKGWEGVESGQLTNWPNILQKEGFEEYEKSSYSLSLARI